MMRMMVGLMSRGFGSRSARPAQDCLACQLEAALLVLNAVEISVSVAFSALLTATPPNPKKPPLRPGFCRLLGYVFKPRLEGG